VSTYVKPVLPSIYLAEGARQFDVDLLTAIEQGFQELQKLLDRTLSFDDNVDCRRVEVVTHATPGTEFSVAHELGKVPTGYIVYGQSAAGSVYDGATANTAATLYLKSDVSSKTFRLLVF
jgi:hypothetical protein